ncbi:MFS transporter [Arthrobacter sp. AZCC_0090]|uniref:MFS transporter n=1 Tax=Arthrobacter sp. AZCC_0090 TaxID=2735881 RepID=UPI00160A046C|nr:MFS transporter [Arthrobacter sp. AZCC_0090]MBB6405374.1 sugar phosphate permease [Arthrobacter sp. AZCC_0090]
MITLDPAQVSTNVDLSKRPYRWLVLVLCWLAFTVTSVDRSTWGPASISIGDDLGVPLASLGLFATFYYIGYVASNAGSGFLTDKVGGRILISVSLVGAGGSMMLFGSTTSAWIGMAVQAVIGLFAGAEYAAGIKLISSWFRPEELGKAMGIYTSATSLGVVVANTAVPYLIEHYSWHASYLLFGAVSIAAGVACYIMLRPGPVVSKKANLTEGRSVLIELGRNKNLLLLALAGFGGFWGTYGFITWSNALMIKGHGIDPTVAGGIVAIYAALGVLGKPLIGWIADKFNGARRVPSMVVLGCFAVMLVVFGLLDNAVAFFVAAPLLGLGAYCYLPLMVALVPRLVSSRVLGGAAGITNAMWQIGSVLVPLAVGAAFTATNNSFMAALITLAAGPFLGMIIMYFVNERPDDVEIALADRGKA